MAATDSAARRDDLVALYHELSDCQKCPLAADRNTVVFGTGDPDADLMFVGEAPGFNEDKQGKPFVGQAGKLLDTAAGRDRAGARAVLHRQRAQVPAPGQPRSCAPGDRGLRRTPVQADRADPAAGGLLARQFRHEAALRAAGGHHEGAWSPAGPRAGRAHGLPVSDLPSSGSPLHPGDAGAAARGLQGAAGPADATAARRGGRAGSRARAEPEPEPEVGAARRTSSETDQLGLCRRTGGCGARPRARLLHCPRAAIRLSPGATIRDDDAATPGRFAARRPHCRRGTRLRLVSQAFTSKSRG